MLYESAYDLNSSNLVAKHLNFSRLANEIRQQGSEAKILLKLYTSGLETTNPIPKHLMFVLVQCSEILQWFHLIHLVCEDLIHLVSEE
jgi:hypothetical protein